MKTKHRLSDKINPKPLRPSHPVHVVGTSKFDKHEQLIQELHAELRAVHLELEKLSPGHSVNLNELLARRENG